MKTRTFTVLITENYEFDQPTDEAAVSEMRDALQTSFDEGLMIGQNFLITDVKDGDADFWKEWKAQWTTESSSSTTPPTRR